MRKRLSSGQKWFMRPYFPLIKGMFVLRSGLRFSFWALEVPKPEMRKRSFSLTTTTTTMATMMTMASWKLYEEIGGCTQGSWRLSVDNIDNNESLSHSVCPICRYRAALSAKKPLWAKFSIQ